MVVVVRGRLYGDARPEMVMGKGVLFKAGDM